MKAYTHTQLHTNGYSSFIVRAQTWKQRSCPSRGEGETNWYVTPRDTRRNQKEQTTDNPTWMNHQRAVMREESQSPKVTRRMIHSWEVESIEMENRSGAARGEAAGAEGGLLPWWRGPQLVCTDVTVLAVTLGVILQEVTTEGTWVTDTRARHGSLLTPRGKLQSSQS